MLLVLGAVEQEGQDSCPSELPIRGGRHFGGSSRMCGKPVVIADLRGVLPRDTARVFGQWYIDFLDPMVIPLQNRNISRICATVSLGSF